MSDEKMTECTHEWKDKGSYFKCVECGETKENIAGVFLYAKGYGLSPLEFHMLNNQDKNETK
jgi:hypothetical protein